MNSIAPTYLKLFGGHVLVIKPNLQYFGICKCSKYQVLIKKKQHKLHKQYANQPETKYIDIFATYQLQKMISCLQQNHIVEYNKAYVEKLAWGRTLKA